MPVWLWIVIDFLFAAGACGVTYLLMRLRMEKLSTQQAQSLAEAVAALHHERKAFQQTAHAIEESAKRQALEEFLGNMRVEERHYLRQERFLFVHRKSLVLEERIFFRNIPLSNWVKHEVAFEEGTDIDGLVKTLSVFNTLEQQSSPRRVRLPF